MSLLTIGESSTSNFVSYPSYTGNDLKPFHSSFYWLAAGVNYTGGNHQYSINDTCSKFATYTAGAPWLANISENFWKYQKDPNVIFRGLGEMIF